MSGDKTTALVTGASSGLGAEFCRQLADRCDVIIAVARRGDRLHRLRDELAGRAELHAIVADLTAIEGVARTMEALRQLGPVDYLVNNAGLGTHGYFSDLPIDGQRDMVSLHIDATMTLCRAAIPFMRERGRGYIINVSSVGAFIPRPHLVVYGDREFMFRCLSLRQFAIYEITAEQRLQATAGVSEVLAAGILGHHIAEVFELEDTARAHEAVESGNAGKPGNVVIRIP